MIRASSSQKDPIRSLIWLSFSALNIDFSKSRYLGQKQFRFRLKNTKERRKRMKEKENMATTVNHGRRGNNLHIKGVTGNIKIVGQHVTGRSKHIDSIDIEVTGIAESHDRLQIYGKKGTVHIISREIATHPQYDITISIPSGVSVKLEEVSGTVLISETVEILTVIGVRPCQIFTEVLHDAILHIGAGVDIKIKRLLGHCDIIANENAKIEVREAFVSNLLATISGDAQVDMHGSARFAKLVLRRHAYFHIDTVELVERQKDQTSTLELELVENHKIDGGQRRAFICQANTEMAHFMQRTLSDTIPPPFVANA